MVAVQIKYLPITTQSKLLQHKPSATIAWNNNIVNIKLKTVECQYCVLVKFVPNKTIMIFETILVLISSYNDLADYIYKYSFI